MKAFAALKARIARTNSRGTSANTAQQREPQPNNGTLNATSRCKERYDTENGKQSSGFEDQISNDGAQSRDAEKRSRNAEALESNAEDEEGDAEEEEGDMEEEEEDAEEEEENAEEEEGDVEEEEEDAEEEEEDVEEEDEDEDADEEQGDVEEKDGDVDEEEGNVEEEEKDADEEEGDVEEEEGDIEEQAVNAKELESDAEEQKLRAEEHGWGGWQDGDGSEHRKGTVSQRASSSDARSSDISKGAEASRTAGIPLVSLVHSEPLFEQTLPSPRGCTIEPAEWGKKLSELSGIRYKELRDDVRCKAPTQVTSAQRELAEHMRALRLMQPSGRGETIAQRLQQLAKSVHVAARSSPRSDGALKQPASEHEGLQKAPAGGRTVKKTPRNVRRPANGPSLAPRRPMGAIMSIPEWVQGSTSSARKMSRTSGSPSFCSSALPRERNRKLSDMDCEWVTPESPVDKEKGGRLPAQHTPDCSFDAWLSTDGRPTTSKLQTEIAPRQPYSETPPRPAACVCPPEQKANLHASQRAYSGHARPVAYSTVTARAPRAEVSHGFHACSQPPPATRALPARHHTRMDTFGLPSTLIPSVPTGSIIAPSSQTEAGSPQLHFSPDHRMALLHATHISKGERSTTNTEMNKDEPPLPWEESRHSAARRSEHLRRSDFDVEWVTWDQHART